MEFDAYKDLAIPTCCCRAYHVPLDVWDRWVVPQTAYLATKAKDTYGFLESDRGRGRALPSPFPSSKG